MFLSLCPSPLLSETNFFKKKEIIAGAQGHLKPATLSLDDLRQVTSSLWPLSAHLENNRAGLRERVSEN